ncbi:MAG: STAS domain-containing protein [Bacteroidota bacterium]|nr:STAS domain-containing protein [Bacteroidota bacterium]MDP4234014.1 STAS domain-containing protein [Bacteroidota bacterium]MDP4242880.1 STAS domain-containing protein [Bacteroidota bacterium]MDP4287681.1 STAS domain-containing protein [Bacteroidota bacterium]
MHFTTEQGDAKTIFRLKEPRLDSQNAGQLKAEFLILAQPDIDALIVDLTQVGYIDSAGISALLLAQRQMKIHEGEVRLVGVRPNVLSMLRLTQLDRIFPIFNTVEEALAAELALPDDDEAFGGEPESEEGLDDPELSLGPGAPTAKAIRAGAIAAGGSFGAAALAKIMMTPYDDELTTDLLLASEAPTALGSSMPVIGMPTLGDDEDFVDDDDFDDDDDDLDDDLDEEEEDLDEEDDVEDIAEEEVLEEDDFEDDDFDDEELEEDEEDDF